MALGALVAFWIGFGRLYLGVHWPSDVLAGWALGALQALVAIRWVSGQAAADGLGPQGRG
jgi:undecaprenyl-diphosphatase